MNNVAIAPPVFIVGCPRSGTTLVQSMLAAHPAVYSPPETHFFSITFRRNPVLRAITWPSLNARIALKRFLNEMERRDLARRFRVPVFERQFARAFVAAMDALAAEAGKTVWVEKTPRHLHFIDAIERQVPGSRFVHVVREGVAVARSLYRAAAEDPASWGGRRTPEVCVERWNSDVRITQRYKDKANHLVVRYDKAVASPEETARRMCEFLALNYDAAMLQPEASFGKVVRDSEAWKHNNRKPIAMRESEDLPWSPEVDDWVRRSVVCLDNLGL